MRGDGLTYSDMLYFVYPWIWKRQSVAPIPPCPCLSFPCPSLFTLYFPFSYFLSLFLFSYLPEYMYIQTLQPGVTFESVLRYIKSNSNAYDSPLSKRQPRSDNHWICIDRAIILSFFLFPGYFQILPPTLLWVHIPKDSPLNIYMSL